MAKKKGTVKVARSAITGRFVTKRYASKHPKTTVVETKRGKETIGTPYHPY